MSENKYIITSEIRMKDHASAILKELRKQTKALTEGFDKTTRAMKNTEQGMKKASSSANSLMRSIRSLSKMYVVYKGMQFGKVLASNFVQVGEQLDNMRIRLKVLLGSTEEANKMFDELVEYAGTVPFKLQDIVAAATTLAGVVKGGREDLMKWLPLIGDLSAATGVSYRETTSQMIRMLSAGASAADMFRERGVLALLGFRASVRYTAWDTAKIVWEAWTGASSRFRGATEMMARTFEGVMSMFSDAWFKFNKAIADAGAWKTLSDEARNAFRVVQMLGKQGTLDEWAKDISDAVSWVIDKLKYLMYILSALGDLVNVVVIQPTKRAFDLAKLLGEGISIIGRGLYSLVDSVGVLDKLRGALDKVLDPTDKEKIRLIFSTMKEELLPFTSSLTEAMEAIEKAREKMDSFRKMPKTPPSEVTKGNEGAFVVPEEEIAKFERNLLAWRKKINADLIEFHKGAVARSLHDLELEFKEGEGVFLSHMADLYIKTRDMWKSIHEDFYKATKGMTGMLFYGAGVPLDVFATSLESTYSLLLGFYHGVVSTNEDINRLMEWYGLRRKEIIRNAREQEEKEWESRISDLEKESKSAADTLHSLYSSLESEVRQHTMTPLEFKLWRTDQDYEEDKRKIQSFKEEVEENIDDIDKKLKELQEASFLSDETIEADKKRLEAQREMYESVLSKIDTLYKLSADKRKAIIDDILQKEVESNLVRRRDTREWLDWHLQQMEEHGASVRELEDASLQWRIDNEKNFFRGMKLGLEQLQMDWSRWGQFGVDTVETLANTVTDSMAGAFTNVIMGTQSLSEAFAAMGQRIINIILDIILHLLIQYMIEQMLAGLGFSLGGLGGIGGKATSAVAMTSKGAAGVGLGTWHSGGIVGPRRFHDGVDSLFQTASDLSYKLWGEKATGKEAMGLRSDEVPAILQAGEAVIPAGTVRRYRKLIDFLLGPSQSNFFSIQDPEEVRNVQKEILAGISKKSMKLAESVAAGRVIKNTIMSALFEQEETRQAMTTLFHDKVQNVMEPIPMLGKAPSSGTTAGGLPPFGSVLAGVLPSLGGREPRYFSTMFGGYGMDATRSPKWPSLFDLYTSSQAGGNPLMDVFLGGGGSSGVFSGTDALVASREIEREQKPPEVVINMINNTGQPIQARQISSHTEGKKQIQDIILESVYTNVEFRRNLREGIGVR